MWMYWKSFPGEVNCWLVFVFAQGIPNLDSIYILSRNGNSSLVLNTMDLYKEKSSRRPELPPNDAGRDPIVQSTLLHPSCCKYSIFANSTFESSFPTNQMIVYHAIRAVGPFGHKRTDSFLISSMQRMPKASGRGRNQNSSSAEPVPNIF